MKNSNNSDINTNKRLFDLVRYSRSNLHEEGLITDSEYAWLCAEADMAKSPTGGSPSPRRLEDYDQQSAYIKILEDAACGYIPPNLWNKIKESKP